MLSSAFPAELESHHTRATGHQIQQAKNKLPLVFFIYNKTDKHVYGAAIFTKVTKTDGQDWVSWHVCRPVRLATPVLITIDMRNYISTTFMMMAQAETHVRRQEASVGGTLGQHFDEFSRSRWRCFAVTTEQHTTIFAGDASYTGWLRTPHQVARYAGVKPEIISLSAPAGVEHHDDAADDDDASDEQAGDW